MVCGMSKKARDLQKTMDRVVVSNNFYFHPYSQKDV